VSPGGDDFGVVAEVIAHAGVEGGCGFHAKAGFGLERGGAGDLGDAAVVLFAGRVFEGGEQSADFCEERSGQSGIDERGLDGCCCGNDGLRAGDQRWEAARGGQTESGTDARMIGFQNASRAVDVLEVLAQIARRGDAQIDAAFGLTGAGDLFLGSRFERGDDVSYFGVLGGQPWNGWSGGMFDDEAIDPL